jgi:predicted nucleotide-binding protein (sugar kinase/HSP70/actin superfamily)
VVDLSFGERPMAKEISRSLSEFGVSAARVRRAMPRAWEAQKEFQEAMKSKGREVLGQIRERTVIIVGRPYNSFERGMNLQIPEKLATLGVLAIPMDMLPTEDISLADEWPNMYWRSGQRILRAARFIRMNELLYPIFIGNFSCGPDSFILKHFKEELGDKPFLHIEIDEHSADAGAITRCEAFLDSIEKRSDRPAEPVRSFRNPQNMKGRTVYLPNMLDHTIALKAAFERGGCAAEVMPEPDRESLELGMKYSSGKECYPFILTTGDMVKLASSPGFDPGKTAFFMPSGEGPCRFGSYNVAHKKVLEKIGLAEVPVLAPNQDDRLYEELGVVGKNVVLNAWKGIIAYELLGKCLHETRPYEKETGKSDSIYNKYYNIIYVTARDNPERMEDVLREVRREFEAVARTGENKPLIGLVGEVYVRLNRFANEDVIRKIEELGGEVWLTPFEEWMYYINLIAFRRARARRDWPATLNNRLKRFFQKKVEHRYARIFEGFLKTLHEQDTSKLIRLAKPYIPDTFEGEAVLSMGKTVDLALRGASGIVNAMPFGCMPGTIVTALMRAINRDLDLPCFNVPYDGTESVTTRLQLEAFMDQAHARMSRTSQVAQTRH